MLLQKAISKCYGYIGNPLVFLNLKKYMCACYQATELSNIKHELVYGQVCLVFIGSTSFEDDLTPEKHYFINDNQQERVQSPPKGKFCINVA